MERKIIKRDRRCEKRKILIHQQSHMSISSMSSNIELDGITKGHVYTQVLVFQHSCLHAFSQAKAKLRQKQRKREQMEERTQKREGEREAERRECEEEEYSRKDSCLCLMRASMMLQISGSLHSAGEPFNYTYRSAG